MQCSGIHTVTEIFTLFLVVISEVNSYAYFHIYLRMYIECFILFMYVYTENELFSSPFQYVRIYTL